MNYLMIKFILWPILFIVIWNIEKYRENKKHMFNYKLINDIIEYIEESERIIDYDRGSSKGVERLIKDGDMPDVYYKLKAINDK